MLLVEDDALQLRTRAAILKAAGFEVVSSLQAEEALLLITQVYSEGSRDSISIVITDHLLAGMNGVEFVRKIRELDQHLPVVVLSGLPDAHLNYDGLNIIFRQKPCPPAEIIALVKHSSDRAA